MGWDIWRRFAPLAVGALLVLELVQVPLALALARRLQTGEQRRRQVARSRGSSLRRRTAADRSDLHDGVVQDITGVTYELDAAGSALPQRQTRTSGTRSSPRRPGACAAASGRCARCCSTSIRPTSPRRDSVPRLSTSRLRRQRTD